MGYQNRSLVTVFSVRLGSGPVKSKDTLVRSAILNVSMTLAFQIPIASDGLEEPGITT